MNNKEALSMIFYSLVNPFVFVFVIFLSFQLRFIAVSGNVSTISPIFIPVYLSISIIVYSIEFVLCYLLTTAVDSKITFSTFLLAFKESQKVFIYFIMVVGWIFIGLEGNIAGLFIFPLFVILCMVCIPYSIKAFLKKIKIIQNQEMYFEHNVSKKLYFLIAGLFVVALTILWVRGPYTGLAKYLEWRTDSPQYIIGQVLDALDKHDNNLILKKIDIDKIVDRAAEDWEPYRINVQATKSEILQQIQNDNYEFVVQQGKPILHFMDWDIGGLTDEEIKRSHPISNFGAIRNGSSLVTVPVVIKESGRRLHIELQIEKVGDEYKIVGISNFKNLLAFRKKDSDAKLRDFNEAKQNVDKYLEFTIKSIDINQRKAFFVIKNKMNREISAIGLYCIARNRQTGEVVATYSNSFKSHIVAGEERKIDFEFTFDQVVYSRVAEGIYIYDFIPVTIKFLSNNEVMVIGK